MPPCIGVTGSIGSGKSTVTRILSDITGWFPISLDTLGHEAYSLLPIQETIREHYGDGVFDKEGAINRQKIGEIVFQSKTEKKWLENIIWPYIIQQTKRLIREHSNCILDGVILYPSGLVKYCQCFLLVQSDPIHIRERTKNKGYSEAVIRQIIKSQTSYLEEHAIEPHRIVIHNNGTIQDLVKTLTCLWEERLGVFWKSDETTEAK